MVGAVSARAPRPDAQERGRWQRWWLVVPVAVVAAWALLRWSGTAPFGSDNDEYRLVAEELLRTGRPVVADVEATKYPLGYPVLLALIDLVGLPVTRAAVALNVGLVVGLGAVVAAIGCALGQGRWSMAGAAYAVGGAGLWGSVFVTMPDVAFLVVFAAVAWRLTRMDTTGDVWGLVALVAGATVLKSVGLLVGLAASVALLAVPGLRRLAWAPGGAAVAVTVATAALAARYPEHTTGYARTFLLVDPTDAQTGEVSLLGLVQRLPDRAHLVLRDVEVAVVGPHLARPWSWLLVLTLVGAGARAVWGRPPLRAFALAFLVTWLPAMALWPYSSVRFELPLVVLAALGAGRLAEGVARRAGRAGAAAVVVSLALHLWGQGAQVARDATFEEATLGVVARDAAASASWAATNIPVGDVVASFAYREVAYRLDRPVLPLGYTSDLESLLEDADAAGARWLVVMPSLYRARGQLEERFVAAFPQRLRLAHDTPTVDTYELLPP